MADFGGIPPAPLGKKMATNQHTRCARWWNDYNFNNNLDNQSWLPTLKCRKYALKMLMYAWYWYMPEICPRYAQDMRKIYLRYAWDMPKICPRYARDMPEICPRYARDMPKICPRYAQDMTTRKTVLTKRLPDKTSKPVLTKCLPDKTSKAGPSWQNV